MSDYENLNGYEIVEKLISEGKSSVGVMELWHLGVDGQVARTILEKKYNGTYIEHIDGPFDCSVISFQNPNGSYRYVWGLYATYNTDTPKWEKVIWSEDKEELYKRIARFEKITVEEVKNNLCHEMYFGKDQFYIVREIYTWWMSKKKEEN